MRHCCQEVGSGINMRLFITIFTSMALASVHGLDSDPYVVEDTV